MKLFAAIKKPLLVLLLTAPAFGAMAQQTKQFAVRNFNQIRVSSGIDLYLTQGTTENIKVTTDAALMDKISVTKEGSQLVIAYKNNNNWNFTRKGSSIKAYVTVNQLNALAASGGSDVYGNNTIKTDQLDIRSSGGADVRLTLAANNITIHSSGGSDVYLKGRATNLEIQASGGSDVHALEFEVQNAKVSSSGGADVDVYVNRALEATSSGGSDIKYKGNAALKNNSSKSGSVRKVN